MANISKKDERLGLVNKNYQNCIMKLIEYDTTKNIWVEFQDKYKAKIHAEYREFELGKIRNPYYPEIFGVGYAGQGIYATKSDSEKESQWDVWYRMLDRCYSNKYPTYKDCKVCDEWHNYQTFSEWYYDNYYNCEDECIHLDKDILRKGNKIYSPSTCVFVPESINLLFNSRKRNRGEYPLDVSYEKSSQRYKAYISMYGKQKTLGRRDTPEEAFEIYKQAKEKYIKEVADLYKDRISEKLYNAMYEWKIEITD